MHKTDAEIIWTATRWVTIFLHFSSFGAYGGKTFPEPGKVIYWDFKPSWKLFFNCCHITLLNFAFFSPSDIYIDFKYVVILSCVFGKNDLLFSVCHHFQMKKKVIFFWPWSLMHLIFNIYCFFAGKGGKNICRYILFVAASLFEQVPCLLNVELRYIHISPHLRKSVMC